MTFYFRLWLISFAVCFISAIAAGIVGFYGNDKLMIALFGLSVVSYIVTIWSRQKGVMS